MLLKDGLLEPLNRQVTNEFHAHTQYVAIATYFDDQGLPELAGHFYKQSEEERAHAMKFVRYILDAGARPTISGIPDIKNDFSSASEAVKFALDQELKVTEQINDLVRLAIEKSDYTTHTFLQWFVTEQVEEVSSMSNLLQIIKHAGNSLLLVEDYVRRQGGAGRGGDSSST
ncbi:ferritin [bacterium CPR1]|nr:ferritin [bacterium CPR1]